MNGHNENKVNWSEIAVFIYLLLSLIGVLLLIYCFDWDDEKVVLAVVYSWGGMTIGCFGWMGWHSYLNHRLIVSQMEMERQAKIEENSRQDARITREPEKSLPLSDPKNILRLPDLLRSKVEETFSDGKVTNRKTDEVPKAVQELLIKLVGM